MNWRQSKSFLYPWSHSLKKRKIHGTMRLAPEKGSVSKEVDNQLDFCLWLPSISEMFHINSALTDDSWVKCFGESPSRFTPCFFVAPVNSWIEVRIAREGPSVLLSSRVLRCDEESPSKSYVVLTNSSYIRKIVPGASRWSDSVDGNAGVMDFIKKSIGCAYIVQYSVHIAAILMAYTEVSWSRRY